MKKLFIGMMTCLALVLTACSDSPAKRVDKMKAMYDEMYQLAEKDGVTNDAVLDMYQEIQDYGMNDIATDFASWTTEERDYFAKVNTECLQNPLHSDIYDAWYARKTGDPNYGQRPEDSDLEKAADQAKNAAEEAADKAKNAAEDAANKAKEAGDAVKGAANDAVDAVKDIK